MSTETALQDLSAGAPEAQRKSLSQVMLRNFESLPVESQASWLQYRWDTIKDRSWIPVLQKIAASGTHLA